MDLAYIDRSPVVFDVSAPAEVADPSWRGWDPILTLHLVHLIFAL
jgi:hypothetical protein